MAVKIKLSGYNNYVKELKRAASRVKFASALYLTELATEGRARSLNEIQNSMIVRDLRFIKGRLAVQPASKTRPPMGQVARTGSKAKPRFSGWLEQQQGGQDKERVGMTLARGGSRLKKLKPALRLKPGRTFPSPANTPIANAQSDEHRAHAFLRIMSRRRKKPFILYGHNKLPSGLWTLEGRHGKGKWPRPRLLQAFDADSRIRRNRWMEHAIRSLKRRFNAQREWDRSWRKAGVTKKR